MTQLVHLADLMRRLCKEWDVPVGYLKISMTNVSTAGGQGNEEPTLGDFMRQQIKLAKEHKREQRIFFRKYL